jgi:hypothetical protein
VFEIDDLSDCQLEKLRLIFLLFKTVIENGVLRI